MPIRSGMAASAAFLAASIAIWRLDFLAARWLWSPAIVSSC